MALDRFDAQNNKSENLKQIEESLAELSKKVARLLGRESFGLFAKHSGYRKDKFLNDAKSKLSASKKKARELVGSLEKEIVQKTSLSLEGERQFRRKLGALETEIYAGFTEAALVRALLGGSSYISVEEEYRICLRQIRTRINTQKSILRDLAANQTKPDIVQQIDAAGAELSDIFDLSDELQTEISSAYKLSEEQKRKLQSLNGMVYDLELRISKL